MKFVLPGSLFHVEDLWKSEQEMLHIYTNEIEKIHFVQTKKRKKLKNILFCFNRTVFLLDMYPKDELYIVQVILSLINYSSIEKQIVKIQYVDFLDVYIMFLKRKY